MEFGLMATHTRSSANPPAGKIARAASKIALLSLTLILTMAPNASAVTIVVNFVGGIPAENAAGGGDLVAIVESAARIWQSVYSNNASLVLYVGWAPIGPAGTHSLIEQGGDPNRETVGLILFDNSGSVSFYLDPTPDSDEEYHVLTEQDQDLGGGPVNVARLFTHPTGDAVGRTDLLTAALHEIGHALGLAGTNISFAAESGDGAIHIANGLPFAGTVIPLATNYSGITTHIDAERVTYGSIMSGLASDERRMPSSLDILANAQISRFTIRRLDVFETPQPPPSPSSGASKINSASSK
jgi:hypothetical protein